MPQIIGLKGWHEKETPDPFKAFKFEYKGRVWGGGFEKKSPIKLIDQPVNMPGPFENRTTSVPMWRWKLSGHTF